MSEKINAEWLAGELRTALEFLDQAPQKRPKKKTGAPQYAAGLRDMAAWLLEIVEKEVGYQSMRSFLAGAVPEGALPLHSSKLELKKKRGAP